jgi:hypothetical protein
VSVPRPSEKLRMRTWDYGLKQIVTNPSHLYLYLRQQQFLESSSYVRDAELTTLTWRTCRSDITDMAKMQ